MPVKKINVRQDDPLDIDGRLYKQVGALLEQLESKDENFEVSMRERIAALTAIARIRIAYGKFNGSMEPADAGSSVRKYAAAFAANAAGKRGKLPRSTATSAAASDRAFEALDDNDRDFDA